MGDYTGLQKKYNEPGVFFLSNSVGVSGKQNAGTYIGRLKYKPVERQVVTNNGVVYPNPNSMGVYYFKFDNDKVQSYRLKCTNLANGKLMLDRTTELSDLGEVILKYDLSFLAEGNYHVQFIRTADNKAILDEKIQKY